MKKSFLLVLCALCCSVVWAAPRNKQIALQLASEKSPAQLVHTALQANNEPAYYVFNRTNGKGFVIIAADDRAHTVLGYSDEGEWDENDIPENMRYWLEGYTQAISSLADMPDYQPQAKKKYYTRVLPICQTNWGQNTPYNNECPTYNGSTCLTGCVATAAAQVMKVHEYPKRGTGSHSYKWESDNGDSITISANFGSTIYHWSDMLNSYASTSNSEQREAVARLMYHCGVACNMKYGTNSSSAVTYNMTNALIEYFDYDKGLQVLHKDYMNEDVLLDSLATELQAGRPILISGHTVKNEGHAFVCDGIDTDGMLHINWGWTGKSNGYFRISAFQPSQQGAGGAASGKAYTESLQFFMNIQPDKGGSYSHSLKCENIYFDKSSYDRYETIKLNIDTLTNGGYGPWTGRIVVEVYKNGKLYAKMHEYEDMKTLKKRTYRPHVETFPSLDTLSVGDYEVVVCAMSSDEPDVRIPIQRKWLGEWRCTLSVSKYELNFTQPSVEKPEVKEVQNPEDYEFTRLSAYYYPSKSDDTHYCWKFQLATSDFYSDDADDNQMLLLFGAFGDSDCSIIGEYPADDSQPYYCISASHFFGNSETYVRTDADKGECEIEYWEPGDSYFFSYYIRLYGLVYRDEVEIPVSRIRAYYGEDYGSHDKGDKITLIHSPEGLEPVENNTLETRKMMQNGVMYILRNGNKYSLQGTKVND
jgi:hypothetical protein